MEGLVSAFSNTAQCKCARLWRCSNYSPLTFFYNQDKETTFEQVKTVSFRTEDSETFPFPELHNVEELKEDCY